VQQPVDKLDTDTARLRKLVSDICIGISSKADKSRSKSAITELESSAEKLLLKYLDELILATLEQSCILAKHRSSDVVESSDINVILSK